jgi:hypothetical protein
MAYGAPFNDEEENEISQTILATKRVEAVRLLAGGRAGLFSNEIFL